MKLEKKTRSKVIQILLILAVLFNMLRGYIKTYSFTLKTPLAANLLKKAAGIEKGSGKPLQEKVGKITKSKIREIAKIKMPDLNTDDINQAMKIIEGTAKQMGLKVEE